MPAVCGLNAEAGDNWVCPLRQVSGPDVVYIAGGWELFTRAEDALLPNAMFEFGEALPCSGQLYAHIREHGDVIVRHSAVETLRRYFC